MLTPEPKIREDVVKGVASDLLHYLSDEIDEELEPSEVLSVVFTLAMHVSLTILEHSAPEDKDYNQQEIINAISTIYAAIKPKIMH